MYHSIYIGDKNTWDDWHIVPTSRPLVNPPEIKSEYVDIPGANGTLDYTEILTGAPVYKNRTGSWEFAVMNDYQKWNVLYNTLLSYLHGHYFDSVILEDEPEYKYKGRLTLNEWKSSKDHSTVTIDYNFDPFKYPASGDTVDWKWDDLILGTGTDQYIIYYGSFDVDGDKHRNFYNPTDSEIDKVSLLFTSAMKVSYTFWDGVNSGARWRDFTAGLVEDSGIILKPGNNFLIFRGRGRVTVAYDRGDGGLRI